MTDERRAASASPKPEAEARPRGADTTEVMEAIDDSDVEVVPAAQHPAVVDGKPPPRASRPAPAEVSGTTATAASQPPPRARESSPSSKRARGRMAIRIPDDEISRPTPAVSDAAPTLPHLPSPPDSPPHPIAVATPIEPLTPMRIINIEASPSQKKLAQEANEPATAKTPDVEPVRPPARSEDLIPIESEPVMDAVESAESLELEEAVDSEPEPRTVRTPPPPARAEATNGATAATPTPAAAVPAMRPRAASIPNVARPPTASKPDIPPPRKLAPTEPEGEEVQFEDEDVPTRPDPSTAAAPAPTKAAAARADRTSEPGDAPEISAEDLVSVESVPGKKVAPPESLRGKMGGPTPAKAFVPPTIATAPAASLPPMRAKQQSVPSVPPPAPKPAPAAAAAAVAAPAVAAPARAPLVIVPPHVGVAPPSSDAASRRKARPWWEDLFNDDYIRTMTKISDAQIAKEADFIEDSLGVAKGGTLLDLACGTGRHAVELSRRGYEMVGFDLSLAMLAKAADEAQEREQKLNFVQGDMREMTFEDAFDGVYSWNTSFGFFDEDTNAKVIDRVHKSLKKGGQFLLDVINRDYLIRQAPSLAWFEGDGCVCMDEMSIDWITSRMKVKRTMMMDDGRSKEIEYTVRVYSLHELGKLLHDHGFRVAEVSGRIATPGVFFGNEAPRTLILAEKR